MKVLLVFLLIIGNMWGTVIEPDSPPLEEPKQLFWVIPPPGQFFSWVNDGLVYQPKSLTTPTKNWDNLANRPGITLEAVIEQTWPQERFAGGLLRNLNPDVGSCQQNQFFTGYLEHTFFQVSARGCEEELLKELKKEVPRCTGPGCVPPPVCIDCEPTVIPEPRYYVVLGVGLLSFWAWNWRERKMSR